MANHELTQSTTIIYSDTEKMQEIITIIINIIQHHIQVGDYSGLRGSGLLKRGEEGDEDVGEDGVVDEDDRCDDGSSAALQRRREREGRGSPLWSLATMAPERARAPPRLDLFSLPLYFSVSFSG